MFVSNLTLNPLPTRLHLFNARSSLLNRFALLLTPSKVNSALVQLHEQTDDLAPSNPTSCTLSLSSTVIHHIALILLLLRPVIRSVRGVLCCICLRVNNSPLLGSCVCLADHGGEVSLGEPLCAPPHLSRRRRLRLGLPSGPPDLLPRHCRRDWPVA